MCGFAVKNELNCADIYLIDNFTGQNAKALLFCAIGVFRFGSLLSAGR